MRSPSVGSSRSGRSGRSGSSSAASTMGSGRRVTPLYNLGFHSLSPTVVTDAGRSLVVSGRGSELMIAVVCTGTDVKVAKFLRRGVEVLGLAILDPTELYPPTTPAQRSSFSTERATLSPTPAPSESHTFLGKFKRLSFKPPSLPAANVFSTSESNASIVTAAGLPIVPLFRTNSHTDEPQSSSAPNSTTGSSSPSNKGYTWTVRKWLRKDLEGKAGIDAAAELRFEWRRGTHRRTTLSTPSGDSHLPLPSPANANFPSRTPRGPSHSPRRRETTTEGEASTVDPNRLVPRAKSPYYGDSLTPDSDRSRSPANGVSGSDDGNDSDPEDSERPWMCEVVYGPRNSERRLLLGTLTPAPYHPKLVAQLAVPFSLSPIALGSFEPGSGSSNEGLSVEGMKDVVSVTCLWLIVRESLGGVAKKRKGDASWRM